MLKTFAFYAAIVAVLVIATIVSRRGQRSPVKQHLRLQRRLTSDGMQ